VSSRIDDEAARLGLGLFLFAHLRLAADADEELASLGLHRTHHRILHLAARAPGTSVGEIIGLLRLTPQGIQGPMRRLIRDGLIEQRSAERDRRKRQIYLTEKGAKLQSEIAAKQYERILRAYEIAGADNLDGFFRVMLALIDAGDAEYLKYNHNSLFMKYQINMP
jgi:DNA-binding MarR family transcriptional regulator